MFSIPIVIAEISMEIVLGRVGDALDAYGAPST